MKRLGGTLAAISMLAAGCGGEASENSGKGASSASPSESVSPSGVPPNIGDDALRVGQTRKGLHLNTTVLEVRQGEAGPEYAQPDPGQEWTVVRAKQCAKESLPEANPASAFDYVGLDDDGGQYDASGTSWDGWPPTPQYPMDRKLSAGQCVSGWMLFQVAKGQRFSKVALNAGDGSFSAEWIVG